MSEMIDDICVCVCDCCSKHGWHGDCKKCSPPAPSSAAALDDAIEALCREYQDGRQYNYLRDEIETLISAALKNSAAESVTEQDLWPIYNRETNEQRSWLDLTDFMGMLKKNNLQIIKTPPKKEASDE